jgi:hypothetical protein
MICVLCHPREIRRGRIPEGHALPLCSRCVAEQRWFKRFAPPSSYKMTAVEQMVASDAMLKASGQ